VSPSQPSHDPPTFSVFSEILGSGNLRKLEKYYEYSTAQGKCGPNTQHHCYKKIMTSARNEAYMTTSESDNDISINHSMVGKEPRYPVSLVSEVLRVHITMNLYI